MEKERNGDKMMQMERDNLLMDFYELTMAQSNFDPKSKNEIVYFDAFFRNLPLESGYAIMAGGEEIIDYIKYLHFSAEDIAYLRSLNKFTEEFLNELAAFRFTGDLYMVPDGTPVFGHEPILTVKARAIEAMLLETALLTYMNRGIKYATAAKQITLAAGDIPVMEFGARRGDNPDCASKYAYMAGCSGTSNTKVGKQYGIPVLGTMAHSMVMNEESEYVAFKKFAKAYPDDSVFLVDTIDTLHSGIPNAVRVANDYLIPTGHRLKGIRIDSGDLAYLSKQARKMLDSVGMTDAKICLSNGLTAKTIIALKNQGACMDSIGAGDNISAPKERVGVVYKLAATTKHNELVPKIKVSNDIAKVTNPGYKKVYRIYDRKTGKAMGDLVALHDEIIPTDQLELIDIENEWNRKQVTNYEAKELQVPIFKDGNLVYQEPSLEEKRVYCDDQMGTLYDEVKRLDNPDKYYVDVTKKLLNLKKELILASKTQMVINEVDQVKQLVLK